MLATRNATRYLAAADRVLPGRITGFYLVGSAALGTWRPDLSDIDFIAVVDGATSTRRLRALHVLGNLTAAARAVSRADPTIPGTVNGAFVAAADMGKPVTAIRPIASHSGRRFHVGRGFDVNPVMWKVLREKGIAVRGPEPGLLGLDPEPARLREWNLGQLRGHWRSWGERLLSGPASDKLFVPAHRAAISRVLGSPRLHHTVLTGEVISKEAAAEYALDVFGGAWQPLLRAALAQRSGRPVELAPAEAVRAAGEFTLAVVADAESREGSA
ncbi:nucleotidyltransferase domain-containing protein [Lentzea sp. NEAU-D7]|uniref:nucleotidyltransferase domain-containing protein n=1 Tax=Lentzea sp. NEAU-D7 TaxID=2994667 RepID=UPI00224B29E5|nr:nucleotidyltransferase domain-containing protein [Lentzea sp. NEAU-D7]MCX2947119.1 nucleotidyltransferase domain-containing protein [Lentzea sp. NEAU-D7]